MACAGCPVVRGMRETRFDVSRVVPWIVVYTRDDVKGSCEEPRRPINGRRNFARALSAGATFPSRDCLRARESRAAPRVARAVQASEAAAGASVAANGASANPRRRRNGSRKAAQG